MSKGIYKRKPFTIKHRKNISNAKKRMYKGKNNPFYGKHHTQRVKEILSIKNSGFNNVKFKGLRKVDAQGYIKIYIPKHPCSIDGRVLEHRYLVEQYINRYLTNEEVVHHINGNRTDNRLSNLYIFPKKVYHTFYEFLFNHYSVVTKTLKSNLIYYKNEKR